MQASSARASSARNYIKFRKGLLTTATSTISASTTVIIIRRHSNNFDTITHQNNQRLPSSLDLLHSWCWNDFDDSLCWENTTMRNALDLDSLWSNISHKELRLIQNYWQRTSNSSNRMRKRLILAVRWRILFESIVSWRLFVNTSCVWLSKPAIVHRGTRRWLVRD